MVWVKANTYSSKKAHMSIIKISLMDVWGHLLFFWRPDGEERVRALFFRLVEVVDSSSVGGNKSGSLSVVSSYLVRLVLVLDTVDEGALRV